MAQRHFHRRLSAGRYALLCALSMSAALAVQALAPSAAHAQSAVAQSFDLPAGSLADALVALGRQAQLQVLFSPDVVAGLSAPAVSGSMTPQVALNRLLARSGLVAVQSGSGFVVRRPADASTGDATTLAPVTVTGRDLTVTEGTGSYTAPAVTIGKNAQSLREIPQSVSVVTRQLLDDQNLTTLDDAMRTVTGITVEAGSIGGNHGNFYSRGYALDTIQVDGVNTPASTGNDLSSGFGLAIYDHIEVLRGPSGLYQGAGDPGGTVNLVRKRAQKEFAFSGQVMTGSWDRYYTEADITGPLDSDGRRRRLHRKAAVLRHPELRPDARHRPDRRRHLPAIQGPPLLRPARLHRRPLAGRAPFHQPGPQLEPHHRGGHRVLRRRGPPPGQWRTHQGQRHLPRTGRAQPRVRLVRLRSGPDHRRHLPRQLEVPQQLEDLWPGRLRRHAL
jgi:hypothetical protein